MSNFTSGQNNNIESDAMFRILISFVLTVFLFLGIIGTAKYMYSSVKANHQIVLAQVSEKVDSRLSIKEIEFITSSDNYKFTSVNALR